VKRGTNIQHGRRRRYPPSMLIPTAIIVVCYPVLIWLLIEMFKAVI